ncbi:glycine-rich domain-containing protein [Serratia fonticola]
MNSSEIPSRTIKAFSVNGAKNNIPVDSSGDTLAAGDATFDSGFPPLTMTPEVAGGKPPKGQDMNGILYAITIKQRWQDAGMGYPYDATFSSALTGYPKGAVIPNSTYSGAWINLNDANVNNPEVSTATATGWVPIYNYGVTSLSMSNASATLTTLQASKDRIIVSGNLTANVYLYFPPWIKDWVIENKTTGLFSVICTTTSPGALSVSSNSSSVTQIHCDGVNMTNYAPAHGMQTFTSSGTFTVPINVTQVRVICTGGGGGGMGCQAGSLSETFSGSGGGAGGTAIGVFQVTPGSNISVTVGAGASGTTGANGAPQGGTSSFGAYCNATGGFGGVKSSVTSTAGGGGGGASGGAVNVSGGGGSDGQIGSFVLSATGGASYWGGGGRGGAQGGVSASCYGAGGGGAYDVSTSGNAYTGGNGRSGVVVIEW